MGDQNQIQFPLQLKLYDDCFHRTIIALERLEAFLEIQRNSNVQLATTAVKSTRDFYDDEKVIPTPESYSQQVDIQASTLLFQVKSISDEKIYRDSARFYLKDLLSWYGGRNESIPFNMVEAFFVPISAIIYRQVTKSREVNEITEKYVTHIITLEEFGELQKRRAVIDGFQKWLTAQDLYQKQLKEYQETHVGTEFTIHKRGTVLDGYKRLFTALTTMYTDSIPARILCKAVSDILPEIAAQCPSINEDAVAEAIILHHNGNNDSNDRQNNQQTTGNQELQFEVYSDNSQSSCNSRDGRNDEASSSNTKTSNDENQQSSKEGGCLSSIFKLFL